MKYTAVALFVCATFVAISGQQRREPHSPEQLLPQAVDGWDPALATAPNGDVYVVAGKRRGSPRDKDFDQRQEIWRSGDGGASIRGALAADHGGIDACRPADRR